jgi:predicted transcriptional regulator
MEVPMADTDLDFDAPLDEALDAEAEADFAAGRVIPHDRMREWLLKLAKGESVPPPEV